MAFAVNCKSCQARFLLNDDLLRRKVAGRVVTVRCRQCHATIEVDASDVDPESLPKIENAPPPPPPPPRAAVKPRAPRAAPPPPRPTAKSTLMGIGAERPAGAPEMVALSPGFLDIKPAPMLASSQGFPEPPPPPGAFEVLDPSDWEIEGQTPEAEEAEPESLDDFAEELPPSVPPEEEMPSSAGTPSLQALTHHDDQTSRPRVDDFLANMTAAMNGGILPDAPTIDVSGLTSATPPVAPAPSIDFDVLETPVRGAKTRALFVTSEAGQDQPQPAPAVTPPATPAEGSLSPAGLDRPTPEATARSEGPRERKNVVAPASKSVPPTTPSRRPSRLAAPLLLALAAAAGFLIWKRSAPQAPPQPSAEAERPADRATAEPPPSPVVLAPAPTEATVAPSASPPPQEELTFETVAAKAQPVAASDKPATTSAAKPGAKTASAPEPEPAAEGAAVNEEPAVEPKPPAEPSGPFDRAAVAAALTGSAAQASACRKEGDPSGVANVVVTFAPSGRVTSANISGPPFAGTPTGGCIASMLRKTRVPAFDGERVTVSKTVVIQ